MGPLWHLGQPREDERRATQLDGNNKCLRTLRTLCVLNVSDLCGPPAWTSSRLLEHAAVARENTRPMSLQGSTARPRAPPRWSTATSPALALHSAAGRGRSRCARGASGSSSHPPAAVGASLAPNSCKRSGEPPETPPGRMKRNQVPIDWGVFLLRIL